MPLIILRISNAMIRETLLPDPNLLFLPKTIGISPLDELHGPLHRDSRRRRKQDMKMVRHYDKLVQQIFPLITVVQKHVDQEERPSVFTKNRHSLPRNRGDEESALRFIHPRILAPVMANQA